MIFVFIIYHVIYDKENIYRKIAAYAIWLNPLLTFSSYTGFITMILFPLLAMYYIKESPLKCGFYLMCGILTYHLYLFTFPLILLYYLREINIKKILKEKNLMHFIKGSLIPLLILLIFIIWDWRSLLEGLFFNSADRFGTNWIQIIAIVLLILFALPIYFHKSSKISILYINFLLIVFYLIENYILNIGLDVKYNHYLFLVIPFIFAIFFEIGTRKLKENEVISI